MDYNDISKLCMEQAEFYDVIHRTCNLADNHTNNWPCDGMVTTCPIKVIDRGCRQKIKDFMEAANTLKNNYSNNNFISW